MRRRGSRGARYGSQPVAHSVSRPCISTLALRRKGTTYVVRENIEGAVVGVRLLLQAVPYIVLRDEVPRKRVQAPSEEARRKQIEDRKSTRLNSSHSGESRMPSSA